ncbi:hypothetical protein HK099_006249 [Clydaea vesicula]|uniref:GH18 domain-containing protein n=1 Tax=Clydaea vesicula TaxID=447962 RepID=A0AAD5XUE0_9FUNG|nr:hypothetical protein HK099_006249 [Clydaea vesicula]KAJ3387262.1 hypothetical protein HDU92_002032 [Lobulomyces angularis]
MTGHLTKKNQLQAYKRVPPKIPEKVIVGYANWHQCDEKILEAVENGVNVLMWFSIDLTADSITGKPLISRGPDLGCVAHMVQRIRKLNLITIHFIAIGGWNSVHPDTRNDASTIYAEFDRWNREDVANPELEWYGFDGFDWDLEGNDDILHPNNEFTLEVLNVMGEMSVLGKKDGYLVSMAPCESYLDFSTSNFSRSARLTNPEWQQLHPEFTYHSANVYSYVLVKFGLENFDFVFLQFYETFSHLLYKVLIENIKPADALIKAIEDITTGWFVDFTTDDLTKDLSKVQLKIPFEKLIVGLGNFNYKSERSLYIPSEDCRFTYEHFLRLNGKSIRGFGFWDIADEGNILYKEKKLYLATELNKFLKIRTVREEERNVFDEL